MNQPQPDLDDDAPGTEPEQEPPLAAEGSQDAPGQPEPDDRKYRPL
jgi:hypothetical protein